MAGVAADATGVPARELRAIAVFETAKGAAAAAAAAGLLLAGPDALREWIAAALHALGLAGGGGIASGWLAAIRPDTLAIAVAVVAAYAAMRVIEGWGLWRGRAWASWLGCIGAAVYLPFELVAVWRQPDWLTWGVLLVNLLVVAVLARDLLRRPHPAP